MARISNEQKLQEIHAEALKEFDIIQSTVKDERMQCLADRRFYSIAGAQWEGPEAQLFDKKPRFEVNKIHLAVMRIFSEYRNNRITVDFVSKEGNEYDDLAETCDGLYRADEQDSVAEEAYDNAFEEAVGGGFGAFRLRTKYEDEYDEENEKQRIYIEPIFDADTSVFFDLDAKRQDKSDAKRCFVLTAMSMQAYKDEYDDDPASWPKTVQSTQFDWSTPDVVFVAEYYRVEEKSELIRYFTDINGEEESYRPEDFENDPELETRLEAIGSKETRQRRIKCKKVHKYIMSGSKILEDLGYIAGYCIPIVPVYGKRWFVDNVERCMGHVRLAKDSQRLKNMQLSKLGEIAALSSIEKPIYLAEQIGIHGQMHSEDNIKQYPYLLIEPIIDANGNKVISGPVGYTKPPGIPPAMAALLQLTEQDMQDILGNQQQGDKIVSNISEKAIVAVQQRLDMQTFIYMSNMAKAIKRAGEIWLSMAKDILVEDGRKMKTVGTQNEIGSVELRKPIVDKESGEVKYQNDLSEAKFDIAVEVGPSSHSKREATIKSLTNMLAVTSDPETQQVLQSMILMNMQGEGVSEVRDYFRQKMLRMGVVKPTEEEMQQLQAEMQNRQPDPNAVYLQAAAEQATAEAAQARAKTVLTVAQAEETRAKTIETLSSVDISNQQQVLEAVKTLQGLYSQRQTVAQPAVPATASIGE